MPATEETIEQVNKLGKEKYKYGFVSDIESETFPIGLDEEVVRRISAKKQEPEWMLEYRLKAFKLWKGMEEPEWLKPIYEKVNYQDLAYYSSPVQKKNLSLWTRLTLSYWKFIKNLVFLCKSKKF